ncbi:DUF4399 domain-containing protein [Aestuariibacter sp. AA17]|uniref:DUF4399 domain-containing protein n=1 Tax=Fluctibacter corallii TaxID=2984329 RepID=A0ABT3A7M6_9ALTE|nr:DUF4399 domain-containing protein [Aestuariibacter sp. AA17]MCV2884608.1 DUF4399 domain-containing protein [Aestuariibacter sp. AA17]
MLRQIRRAATWVLLLCSVSFSSMADTAKAYFIYPSDGQTVPSTFNVVFGLKGMGIAPAGIDFPNTGHHHLLIDQSTLPDMSKPLPANENVRHFGKGQTETIITLPKGKHTLQLVLGDYLHTPHDKAVVSEKITVLVK